MRTIFTLVSFVSCCNAFLTVHHTSQHRSSSSGSTALFVLQEPARNGVRVPKKVTDAMMLEEMSRQMKDMNEQMEEWSTMYPRKQQQQQQSNSYVFAGKKDYKVQPWYNGANEQQEQQNEETYVEASSPMEEEAIEEKEQMMMDDVAVVAEEETPVVMEQEESEQLVAATLQEDIAVPIEDEGVSSPVATDDDEQQETLMQQQQQQQQKEEEVIVFHEDVPLNDEFYTGKKFKLDKTMKRTPPHPPMMVEHDEMIPAEIVTPPDWHTDETTRATNLRLAERLKNAHSIIQELTAENDHLKSIQMKHEHDIAEIQAQLKLQDETFAKERQAALAELEHVRTEGTLALETAQKEAKAALLETTKTLQAKLTAAESLVAKLEATMQTMNNEKQSLSYVVEEPPEPSPSVVPQDDDMIRTAPAPPTPTAVSGGGVRKTIKKTLGAIGGVLPFHRRSKHHDVELSVSKMTNDAEEEEEEEEPKLEA